MTQTIQPVVLLWGRYTGYRFAGPFASVAEANEWALLFDEHTGLLEWHTAVVDPAVPLAIHAPDAPAGPPGAAGSGAAFFVLMPDGDPPHLVGPFADHRAAVAWGSYNEEVRQRDFGWQLIWLENPTAPPLLLSADAAMATRPAMVH
jgi:hypothetical protein